MVLCYPILPLVFSIKLSLVPSVTFIAKWHFQLFSYWFYDKHPSFISEATTVSGHYISISIAVWVMWEMCLAKEGVSVLMA